MRGLLLLALVCLVGAAEVAPGAGIVITLRPAVTIAAGQATLGDIAEIVADEATSARLAAVTVQELPDLGRHVIAATQARALVARLVAGRSLSVSGSCALERAALTISPERFASAAEAAIRAKVGAAAQIAIARAAAAVIVPDDTTAPCSIEADPLVADPLGEVPVRLRVLRAGRELGRGMVVLNVRVLRDQVVAARPIARGATIGLDDLRLEAREARPADAGNPTSAETILGWQARVDITPGMAITRRLAQPVPAVRGGRAVELLFLQDQFALVAPGMALGDGAIGEIIQVRRLSDNRAVAAKVIADGKAQINF